MAKPDIVYRIGPSFTDLLNNNANKNKGVFLKADRFPKVCTERIGLNAQGINNDKTVISTSRYSKICL